MPALFPSRRFLTAVPFFLSALAFALENSRADAPAKAVKAADDPVVQAARALYEGIRAEKLDNGLRVYLKPVPGAPLVSVMTAYKVGSADEDLDKTGLSHYLEHLMFKGTRTIMPGDIDRLTLRNGGANNAYTSDDYTIYHFDFAADRWENALEVEADRMRNLCIDDKHEFEKEKEVVVAELERGEDEPWDLEMKTILPLLFGKSGPYGHPVIGAAEHVRGATALVIKEHYDKWYHPNNAALIVCGGFDPDKALARIKKLFGPIPARELPKRKSAAETSRTQPIKKEIDSKFDVPRMLMGFNTVPTGHADSYALEVLQAVLASGKTARLYKKLVEGEELAGAVGSSNSTGRYPGWFSINVELLKGKDRAKTEELILAEIKRLRDEPVSAVELKRVQRSLVAGTIFQRESVHNLADSIAQGVTTNDLDYLKNYLPRMAAVTAKDVQEAARKYLKPEERVVVWSIPKKEGRGAGNAPEKTAPRRLAERARAERGGSSGEFSLQDAKRVVLKNGLTLLLFENHRLPIVVAEAALKQPVRLHEPAGKNGIAALTGRLLDEGTAKYQGPEIAELIEDAGGSLSLDANGGSVKVLAPDRSLGLSLLLDCLTQPSFSRDAFQRERERLLSEIDDALRQPETRAQMLFREQVYGAHPYSRPSLGTRKTVESLTPDDCRAFHRRLFLPNNMILAVVGAFDADRLVQELTRLTADWKPGELPRPPVPAVDKPNEFTQKIATQPDAAQLHFYMGHVGIRRNNPDYYKLLVMDYVLGTGPGFTDRLSSRLRDREGLAYTVSANISSSAGDEPGTFACYIGTAPENFAKVKGMFLEELNRIRDEKPKTEEVEDAKKYLLGNLPFQLTTNERIASQLLAVERHQLGRGYLDDYRKAVAAVTPEDVQAVARKYLDPARMFLVAVGALDAEGKKVGK